MNNLIIRKALEQVLSEVAADAGVPVAWENVHTEPPTDGIFIESDFLPAGNNDIALQGSGVVRRGVYQVTVVYPINSGTQAAAKLVAKIIEAFPNNKAIQTVEAPVYINGAPSDYNGIRDDTAFRIPISIPYIVTA